MKNLASLIIFFSLILTLFSANLQSENILPRTRIKAGNSVFFEVSLSPLSVAFYWTNAFEDAAKVWTKYSDNTSQNFSVKPGATEQIFGTALDNYRTATVEITIGKRVNTCQIYISKLYNWSLKGWSADCQERRL